MTSIVVSVPTKGDLTFDLNNEIIFVEDTIDDLTGQEIYNAARDVEDDTVVLSFEKIVNGAGKSFLGSTSLGNKQTGATVTLLRGWHIQSQKTSGSLLVFDANVVNETDGGEIFNDVAGVAQVNILIGDGVEVVVNVGSGLSAEEQVKLTNIDNRTAYHDKIINNLKEIRKISGSWYLIIYDTGEVSGGSEILRKKLTDHLGADITDLTAGVLSAELETTA